MNSTVVSVCHSVELVPLSEVLRFARFGPDVAVTLMSDRSDRIYIPGTVTVSATISEGIINKKISFERSDMTPAAAMELESLASTRLICLYTDERGTRRVCGSPSWPLTLRFVDSGGAYQVSISGSDTATDGILSV